MLIDIFLLRLFNVRFVFKMVVGLSEDVFFLLMLLFKVRKVVDKYFKGNIGIYIFVGWIVFNFIY